MGGLLGGSQTSQPASVATPSAVSAQRAGEIGTTAPNLGGSLATGFGEGGTLPSEQGDARLKQILTGLQLANSVAQLGQGFAGREVHGDLRPGHHAGGAAPVHHRALRGAR